MRHAPARVLGAHVETLFGTEGVPLVNPLVHANYSKVCTAAQRRSLLSRNMPRTVQVPAVGLVRYPPGTLVDGDRSYLVLTDGAFVDEQMVGWLTDHACHAGRIRKQPVRDVDAPCILAARFGEASWGHWLAEIFLRAAIAERLHPSHFLFAVPAWATRATPERSYATAVLESFAAYGIVPERLVPLEAGYTTRFSQLHDIADAWSDGPHPEALATLRAVSHGGIHTASRKIASLRRRPEQRALYNDAELDGFLRDLGFDSIDLRTVPFLEQVALFRQAEVVVGSLGSTMTSTLFARDNAPIVTLAPSAWEDGYFIRLFQRSRARHADVRGPSTLFGGADSASAAHLADMSDIERGLRAVLEMPGSDPIVDGEAVPHALGACVLSVIFGRGGNAGRFTQSGWAEAEETHTWSLGAAAGLIFDGATFPQEDLWLEIEGMGHVHPPHMPTRPLAVRANGVAVGRFDIIDEVRLFCRVPRAIMTNGSNLLITIEHSIRPSPKLMGAGEDTRRLGFGFRSVAFYRTASATRNDNRR